MSENRSIVHNPAGKEKGWYVESEDGSHFFNAKPYSSKAEAEKLLEAVEAHKHAGGRGLIASDGLELRVHSSHIALRKAPEGSNSPGTLIGYAARFGDLSVPLPIPGRRSKLFRERIMPGAFRAALDPERDILALRNHEEDKLLGRRSAGTLRLMEDRDGLMYEVDLPDTTHGRDTAELVSRGDIKGNSFGFKIEADGDSWDFSDPESPVRTVHRIAMLRDVGPVTDPAYPTTRVSLRSLAEAYREPADESLDRFLFQLRTRVDLLAAEAL